IYPEDEMESLILEKEIDEVVFAYSDVSHQHVMHLASRAMAAGAGFRILPPRETMLPSKKPIISICAVRTGCGKSQTSRHILKILRDELGVKRIVAVRHPMPYGDLAAQAVQRFASYADLDRHQCTIEEREEYEPYIDNGAVIYAGVDYQRILDEAEKEADLILWDGGNNDLPFYRPDLHIVVTDPHRAGHELAFHPGEANFRMADVVIINKVDTASAENVAVIEKNLRDIGSDAIVLKAASPVSVENPANISGKKVLVIEDGPTLTHGGMQFGAGVVAAQQFAAAEIVDPRPYAVGSIRATFEKYPNATRILPAMGYGDQQIRDLQQTIDNVPADLVVVATPIDLSRLVTFAGPYERVRYSLEEKSSPGLASIIKERFPFLQ
nr:GTPase [Calditrichia bacterium]